MPASQPGSFDAQAFLDAVGLRGDLAEYPASASIYRRGDECGGVMYVLSGQVSLRVPRTDALVATMGPTEFFGEGCLTGQPRRLTDARANLPTVLRVIPSEQMSRLLREQPLWSDHFLTYLLRRSIRVEQSIVRHTFNAGERRLARALIRLALDAVTEQDVLPAVSETALADVAGTTATETRAAMARFARNHFIEYGPRSQRVRIEPELVGAILRE